MGERELGEMKMKEIKKERKEEMKEGRSQQRKDQQRLENYSTVHTLPLLALMVSFSFNCQLEIP